VRRRPRFDAWIRHIDSYRGTDLLYLNVRGNIPAQAVINAKERRENPFREKRRFDLTGPAAAEAEGREDEGEVVAGSDEETKGLKGAKLLETEG
jgi:tRNA pseudouridine38-40 synthase